MWKVCMWTFLVHLESPSSQKLVQPLENVLFISYVSERQNNGRSGCVTFKNKGTHCKILNGSVSVCHGMSVQFWPMFSTRTSFMFGQTSCSDLKNQQRPQAHPLDGRTRARLQLDVLRCLTAFCHSCSPQLDQFNDLMLSTCFFSTLLLLPCSSLPSS